jgi:hypothetical protein
MLLKKLSYLYAWVFSERHHQINVAVTFIVKILIWIIRTHMTACNIIKSIKYFIDIVPYTQRGNEEKIQVALGNGIVENDG